LIEIQGLQKQAFSNVPNVPNVRNVPNVKRWRMSTFLWT